MRFSFFWPKFLPAWAGSLLLLATLLFAGHPALALQGTTGAHDPSTIIKRNGVYHIWTTGDQIAHLTSTDLINWTQAAPVFAPGTWPSWINGYVAGFAGNFWAPECVFMNGKYYLYYSCSMGQRPCAIGVATSTDLTNWTDQGMVVYSNTTTAYGSIDPAVFTDATGKVWMVFGSHLVGNWIMQLDPVTGKRLNSTVKNIAGASPYCENEASYVMQRGGYYYLFYNKGTCCDLTRSTYYVQMGRSTSPTGPYLDRNGRDLLSGGGTNFLVGTGVYHGPGQVGFYSENGGNFLTYHYYDGTRNGYPTLGIGNLKWDSAGWPYMTRDWLAAGRYKLANVNNGKVWDAWGCTGVQGQAVAQGTSSTALCQQWNLAPLGNGEYKITSAVGAGLAVDVLNNSPANGATLQLYPYSGIAGQRFRIERSNTGAFVLSSLNSNRVVEVPNCSATDGVTLAMYDYLGNNCQKWTITAAAARGVLATQMEQRGQFSVYPNPVTQGRFVVALSPELSGGKVVITLADMQGRRVYARSSTGQASLPIEADLRAGVYVLQVSGAQGTFTERVVVQ